jgi:hypothetical protein
LNKSNFNASSFAESIESQWNDGAKESSIKVNGEEYSTNFEISGHLTTESEAKEKQESVESERIHGDGTSWARTNFIEIGENLANENVAQNKATLRSNADVTTRAHEVGHLMGLRHPGDPKKDFPVLGQPGIMATIFNSVDAAYSVDGKPTKWEYDEKGVPKKAPVEGKLDITKRRALPSEVSGIVNRRQGKGTNGKYFVNGLSKK